MTTELKKKMHKAMVHYEIPTHCQEPLLQYIFFHRPGGSFLTAILCGDLFSAVNSADSINKKALVNYAEFLKNEVNPVCWGSPARVHRWLTEGNKA